MRRIIRKFAQNIQVNKHTEISNTEATLIPCGSPGGAGQYYGEPYSVSLVMKYLFITKITYLCWTCPSAHTLKSDRFHTRESCTDPGHPKSISRIRFCDHYYQYLIVQC